MNGYYTISGVNQQFKTLKDAKYHVYIAYTPNERIKYLNDSEIVGVKNENIFSSTTINIRDNGAYTFGKTIKL